MQSVAQTYQDLLEVALQQPPIDLSLADAMGCVLAQPVVAPFAHPFGDVAGKDGFAVVSNDTAGASAAAPVRLEVVADVPAGTYEREALLGGTCVRIVSGAPMPINADAVIAGLLDGDAIEVSSPVAAGDNVRTRGEDLTGGDVLLQEGTRLAAQQIAALAAAGIDRVVVHPKPRVVVVSVGDELAEPGAKPRHGAVFDANGPALAAAAQEAGVEAFRVSAAPDEPARLREVIEDQLMRADLVITTGALSVGDKNIVRDVMESLGTAHFDEVAARPAHSVGIAVVGDGRDSVICCLPGDPVAAQVCFEVYVRPALRKMQGWAKLNRAAVRAQVDRGWSSPAGRRDFVRVRLAGSPAEGYVASVMGDPGATWVSALAASNALAVIPEDVTEVVAGDQVTCLLLEQ